MKKNNRIIAAIIFFVPLILLLFIVWVFYGRGGSQTSTEDAVYGDTVASITGMGYTGGGSTFSGIVESQKTSEIKKDADKTVGDIYVEEGQNVAAGDALFTYDVEALQLSLEQANLELEGLNNQITQYQSQIDTLTKEKATAAQSDQLNYTLQIQSAQLDLRTAQYQLTVKQKSIDNLNDSIANAIVYSDMDGVIKSIKESASTEEAFITILADGDYRVKGTANEMTVGQLTEGMSMIIRSRVDESQTWNGTIASIDRENVSESSTIDYYSSSSSDSASKYYFYVTLDDPSGLMLGQHVYVEESFGTGEEKEGIWLPEYYIVSDETGDYVWAADENSCLEKRIVSLGDYDEELGTYQITDGLTEEDILVYPDESLTEGSPVLTWDAYEADTDSESDMIEADTAADSEE